MRYCLHVDYCMSAGISRGPKREVVAVVTVFEGAESKERKLKRIEQKPSRVKPSQELKGDTQSGIVGWEYSD